MNSVVNRSLRQVCVFCGSYPGREPLYLETARRVGRALATTGIGIVYGGGRIGLMGAMADAALAAGGSVVGVIPERLASREVTHDRLTALHVVSSMHERKMLMGRMADAFIALPGGYGTFEEFCEVVTWTQLGIHSKPCGLLNVNGFFDPLLAQFDRALSDGFIVEENRACVVAEKEIGALLESLRRVRLPHAPEDVERPAP